MHLNNKAKKWRLLVSILGHFVSLSILFIKMIADAFIVRIVFQTFHYLVICSVPKITIHEQHVIWLRQNNGIEFNIHSHLNREEMLL